MTYPLITPPSAEALTLAEVKAHLWLDDGSEDALLASLISVTGPGTHRLLIPVGLGEHAITLVFVVAYVLLGVAMIYVAARIRRWKDEG